MHVGETLVIVMINSDGILRFNELTFPHWGLLSL